MDNLQIGRHISGQFNEDLERVINNVMHMGGLVEKQLTDALAAVDTTDVTLAKEVLSNDYQVNAFANIIGNNPHINAAIMVF